MATPGANEHSPAQGGSAQTGDQPDFKMPILPPSSDSTPRPTPFEMKHARQQPIRGGSAPVFLGRFCLMIINLPLHFRVHNLRLISFGFSPDA